MKVKFTMMMMCLWLNLKAQEDTRPWMPLESRIGIAVGLGKFTYLDKNSSPLVYQSKPKNVRVFYNLESNKMLFAFDLDVKVGSNKPKYHGDRTLFFEEEDYHGKKEEKKFPAGGSFLAGRISLGAFYKIKSTQQSTFKVATGMRIANELVYPQGWTAGGIMNALSFSPEAVVQHRVDSYHSFTAFIRNPLITNLTRLPYSNSISTSGENKLGAFFKNSEWVGMKKFLAPAFGIGYNYQINQRWGASLQYEWNWYHITTPATMKAVSQSLLANFHHQF